MLENCFDVVQEIMQCSAVIHYIIQVDDVGIAELFIKHIIHKIRKHSRSIFNYKYHNKKLEACGKCSRWLYVRLHPNFNDTLTSSLPLKCN